MSETTQTQHTDLGSEGRSVMPPGELLWICHGAMFQRPAGQPDKWDDLPIPEKVRWACVEEGFLKEHYKDAAPSPDRAGDGGDLGELERLRQATDIIGLIKKTYGAGFYISGELQERMSRFLAKQRSSGKLLPSIQGQGDGGTGALANITDLRTECGCNHPLIKCDIHGCRCQICGLPERLPDLTGAPTSPSGHSRAEPSGLGPEAECPSRGPADLVGYLHRQWAWSKETFGPALRTKGILQHITKELREIEAEPHDLAEWVDVIILAMDGFWRHGGKPEDLLPAMQAKQDKNFARQWPDWRTMGEDQAIEHDRSGEVALAGEARSAETHSGSVHEHAATSVATPKHSPEPNPPMSVEEARAVINSLDHEVGDPEEHVSFLQWCAEQPQCHPDSRVEFIEQASRIEAALRTLSENGEVDHG